MKGLPIVVSATALAVAVLGSTPLGQAAQQLVLPNGSVGAAQLKKNAVTGLKIKNSAVTSAKVKKGTLLAAHFKAGQLPAGPQGPQGPPGPAGVPPAGTLTKTIARTSVSVVIGAGDLGVATAECLAGEKAIGGGFIVFPGLAVAQSSSFHDPPTAWRILVRNPTAAPQTARATVVCAS